MTKGYAVGVQLPKGLLVFLSEELKILASKLEVLPRDVGIHLLCRSRSFIALQVCLHRRSVGKVSQVVPNLS